MTEKVRREHGTDPFNQGQAERPQNQIEVLESRLKHMQRVVETQQEELLELYRRIHRRDAPETYNKLNEF